MHHPNSVRPLLTLNQKDITIAKLLMANGFVYTEYQHTYIVTKGIVIKVKNWNT